MTRTTVNDNGRPYNTRHVGAGLKNIFFLARTCRLFPSSASRLVVRCHCTRRTPSTLLTRDSHKALSQVASLPLFSSRLSSVMSLSKLLSSLVVSTLLAVASGQVLVDFQVAQPPPITSDLQQCSQVLIECVPLLYRHGCLTDELYDSLGILLVILLALPQLPITRARDLFDKSILISQTTSCF